MAEVKFGFASHSRKSLKRLIERLFQAFEVTHFGFFEPYEFSCTLTLVLYLPRTDFKQTFWITLWPVYIYTWYKRCTTNDLPLGNVDCPVLMMLRNRSVYFSARSYIFFYLFARGGGASLTELREEARADFWREKYRLSLRLGDGHPCDGRRVTTTYEDLGLWIFCVYN